ncbi:hypothetical protein MUN76_11995 [Leucobacter rhizosphaerae]|uniref:Uncharacterized protein n=1 Tax=Leucobacter rhizosphaerae TaxID=2932245 RepID=A0ABY4FU06_9MICO|nr:hypothetical protein [Leucobacter rhizosphaerae]UOQ59762.1 hypothetical protein MUN76_11995 [Leucobacter rhizosphaerae]
MHPGGLIQIETNVWVVMREVSQHPKAVIHKITDTTGDDRYMLMTWAAEPSARRMVGSTRGCTPPSRPCLGRPGPE